MAFQPPIFPSVLHGSAVRSYQPIQLQESKIMLKRIVESPEAARQHMRSLAGSAIMRVTYGARDVHQTRKYVQRAEKAMDSARKVIVPGPSLVEFFRFLQYVLAWMPGGAASRHVAEYKPSNSRDAK